MAELKAPHRFYPAAMANITNRCTLRCRHCFVFREGNPNDPGGEMDTASMLRELARIKKHFGVSTMLWMGGEPLLRPDVLCEGVKLFQRNHITTNGTLELIDFPDDTVSAPARGRPGGRRVIYVVSIDGPPELNDSVRGKGSFSKVMDTLDRMPDGFGPTVMCQCVVTAVNEGALGELVEILRLTRLEGMTFSFYVPRREDDSEFTWGTLERRDSAVREAIRLKRKHPDFIWNNLRSLELMLSDSARAVTENCPSRRFVLPLYLEGERFVVPYCCYGNDVDCELCGAWVVFYIAALLERAGQASYPGG